MVELHLILAMLFPFTSKKLYLVFHFGNETFSNSSVCTTFYHSFPGQPTSQSLESPILPNVEAPSSTRLIAADVTTESEATISAYSELCPKKGLLRYVPVTVLECSQAVRCVAFHPTGRLYAVDLIITIVRYYGYTGYEFAKTFLDTNRYPL
ncbi:unnamed protein product [Protopolystoma xenopodis]|uniref:Uncharacterized protein n=1 Tax=Protopolystoma xenopodis TaxID=117903 RepID=A0A448X1P6_9PLAT|nr:unnamed protein product [Protopolystoma xenopodis]